MQRWKSSRNAWRSLGNVRVWALLAALLTAGLAPAQQAEVGDLLQQARRNLDSDLASALADVRRALSVDPDNAEAHFLLARCHERQKRFDRAQLEYERAVQCNLAYAEPWVGLGMLYLEQSQPPKLAEAADALGKAVKLARGQPKLLAQAHYGLAQVALAENRLGDGIANLQLAVQADPTHVRARLDLGFELLSQERFQEAEQHLSQAARLAPTDPLPHFYLGLLHDALDQPEAALAAYNAALKVDPNDRASLYNKAALLERIGRTEEARAAYEALLNVDPQQTEVALKAGHLLSKLGKAEDAVARLQAIARAQPDNLEAQVALGAALLRAQRFGEARRQFELVLRRDGANEEALRSLGRMAEAQEDHEAAARYYAQLWKAVPSSDSYGLAYARSLARTGDAAQALSVVQVILDRAPDSLEAQRLTAQLYDQLRQPERALENLLRVLDREPNDVGSLSYAASLLERLERSGEAAELYLRATRISPKDAELRRRCARCLSQSGRHVEALEQYREASWLLPGDAQALIDLARACAAARNVEALHIHLSAFLEANPEAIEVWPVLLQAYGEAGQADRGLAELERAYAAQPSPCLAAALARALAEAGHEERARATALAVCRGKDAPPQAIAAAARALTACDAPDEAALHLMAALKRYGDRADLYSALGEAYVALGNVVRAAEYFRKALEIDGSCEPAREGLQKLSAQP